MARCCAEHGYPETTVETVIDEAGVDRPAFDRNFQGKEDLALAAVDSILAAGMATVGTAYSPDTNEIESALGSLAALLELFASRPELARFAFIEPRHGMPESARERYRSGFSILTAMLDRLRDQGRLSSHPPPCAARAAIGGGEALVRRELECGRGADLPHLLPALVYSAAVPFLGQREALRYARLAAELTASR
ncbi:MAG TPA: TetR/AcrR family transcriptional regulator [Solirubrobacterales bacterium]|nr:TetR/AcrR family transcriptional regulator [Solirubrobacterales bacterium]